jgi:sortase A
MHTRTSNILAAIIVIVALGIFSATLVHTVWYAPDSQGAQANVPITDATTSLPARLIIPALNINASVQHVGVNVAGAMRAPDNFTDVAWYKYGTTPGNLGSAVIDGHVDNGLGLNGVFKYLDTIKVGDDVYVQTANGSRLHFVVSDIESYPYQSVPLQTLFARDDAARLNLITCEGDWVAGGDTYDHRLVVYATLVL